MSHRTAIINSFIAHLENHTSAIGYRGYRFLHEINSFPSFYVAFQNEARLHRGDRYGILALNIRGYSWADNVDPFELYMRELETAVQTYRPQHLRFVDEARVISVRTDEGVMQPYGIVDLNVEILYRLDPNFTSTVRADSTVVTADNMIIKVDNQ